MRFPSFRSNLSITSAFVLAAALSACGTGGSTAGDGTTTKGSTQIRTTRQMNTPARGQTTSWRTFNALPGLDYKIRASSNISGLYIIYLRNRYKQKIHFSYDVDDLPPPDTSYRHSRASGDDGRMNSFQFSSPRASIYMLIERVRFGSSDTGPYA